MSGEIYEPERRMFSALLRIPYQAINDYVVGCVVAAGYIDIRPAHVSVFQHLPRVGARITELAERAQITKQSMSYLIEHLEANGYIERVPDPRDGRARIVRLTDRGWAVDQVAREAIAIVEQAWRERIGAAKFEQLRANLQEVIAIIERGDEEAGRRTK